MFFFFVDSNREVRSGGPFLFGTKVSMVDLSFLIELNALTRGHLLHVPTTALDEYPNIQTWIAAVYAEPHIAAHYETNIPATDPSY